MDGFPKSARLGNAVPQRPLAARIARLFRRGDGASAAPCPVYPAEARKRRAFRESHRAYALSDQRRVRRAAGASAFGTLGGRPVCLVRTPKGKNIKHNKSRRRQQSGLYSSLPQCGLGLRKKQGCAVTHMARLHHTIPKATQPIEVRQRPRRVGAHLLKHVERIFAIPMARLFCPLVDCPAYRPRISSRRQIPRASHRLARRPLFCRRMQAALRPAYAGKVRRRKAAHWAAFLPIKRAACPMFGTNRPACVAGGAKRCPRAGNRARTALRPYVLSRTCAENLRAGPARVPQDAAFPEKQNADRPRRGVMRPEPPHRAGFLCRLPVFRVLTAWQAKGRPKSVRFCADYEKSRRL